MVWNIVVLTILVYVLIKVEIANWETKRYRLFTKEVEKTINTLKEEINDLHIANTKFVERVKTFQQNIVEHEPPCYMQDMLTRRNEEHQS